METINKAKSFAPTDVMRNNARRGLALREKYNRGGLDASQAKSEGVGSGVARARDIINGNLSLDTVKRMYAFFSRHEKNYNPKKKIPDGVPAAGTAAAFILDATNAGSSSITWFSGVQWQGGTAPTLTASGRDILGFFTHDAGTTWNGLVLARDIK